MNPFESYKQGEESQLPTAASSKQHYSVPEGYFEKLQGDILSRIDQTPVQMRPEKSSLWTKVRPILYLAACFVSLMLILQVVKTSQEQVHTTPAIAQSGEDEYIQYYQDYSQNIEYSSAEESLWQEM